MLPRYLLHSGLFTCYVMLAVLGVRRHGCPVNAIRSATWIFVEKPSHGVRGPWDCRLHHRDKILHWASYCCYARRKSIQESNNIWMAFFRRKTNKKWVYSRRGHSLRPGNCVAGNPRRARWRKSGGKWRSVKREWKWCSTNAVKMCSSSFLSLLGAAWWRDQGSLSNYEFYLQSSMGAPLILSEPFYFV